MKIIAMIPARYEASRFPGKLMQLLDEKPVIVHTYQATKATGLFDEVYVVTDSDIILNTIKKVGGKVIKSQKEHECGSDRIAEAVENMEVDIVINVQGDEPFIDKESLKKLISVFNDADANRIDLASVMTKITDVDEVNNPNNVKVITNQDNFALYFSRSPIPYPREKNMEISYFKHKGVYAFRKTALLDFYYLPMRPLEAAEKIECLRYLEYGKNIKMVLADVESVGIDTPEDLEKAKRLLQSTVQNKK